MGEALQVADKWRESLSPDTRRALQCVARSFISKPRHKAWYNPWTSKVNSLFIYLYIYRSVFCTVCQFRSTLMKPDSVRCIAVSITNSPASFSLALAAVPRPPEHCPGRDSHCATPTPRPPARLPTAKCGPTSSAYRRWCIYKQNKKVNGSPLLEALLVRGETRPNY